MKLAPHYLPVPDERIELDAAKLCRCEQTDYLFLVRREKSWLFDLTSVYTPNSYENLTWTYGSLLHNVPTVALFLHVDKVVDGLPWGSVTILDYPTTLRDVEQFSAAPYAQRKRHIQLITKRCTRHVQACSMLELIEHFKEEGGKDTWT